MKKFLIVLLSFIITSCSFKDNNSESIENQSSSTDISSTESNLEEIESSGEKFSLKEEKNIKYDYPLDGSKSYKKDDSLFVNRMLFTYPAEITAQEKSPYLLDDLKNLDYAKDVYYEYLNFRIPKRSEIYSNDRGIFAIDFPKTKDYGLRIYFRKLYDEDYFETKKTKDQLLSTVNKFMENIEEKEDERIVQKPYEIYDSQMDAYYFISENEKMTHTYLFVGCPKNVVFFDIVEAKNKSDVSKYIMADLLSTMYIETEDPINVVKDFSSYSEDMDIYASNKVDFDDFSVSLPKNMKTVQDDVNFKGFANQKNRDLLSYVLVIRSPKKAKEKKTLSLEDFYNKTSGSSLPPAYIVNMGRVESKSIKDKKALSSEIRIYMDNNTSQGIKTSLETEDDFITILVTGPLANSNETKLLNKNIIESLEFK